ncbi:hypothetical protein HFP15_16050 [Amycolatopsis sp. K13G38]|uniref:IclR-ED domain-containing protein n=1 Tax=Amycolatopsis acididurans TaxID=2724524 RepID=A0ABX1J649_9PSEU|nr:IclR family transcriptional regulator C-terminal domain-containing protein [Amycolatopsis acididurans]NKQ54399.1 hypothetical protein [Amycolatopsis acididurans]
MSYLECLASSHPVQMCGSVGMRVRLHATSQCKVILAFLPDGVAECPVAQLDYVRYTGNTITSSAALAAKNRLRTQPRRTRERRPVVWRHR